MNEIFLSGRAVEDFNLRYSQKGNAFGRVRVSSQDGQEVLYISVITFGELAEKLRELKKGDMMFIKGRLKMDSYKTDAGEQKTIYEIVAKEIKTVDELSTMGNGNAPF